jgi:predicted Rossmann-fold nucleotide-binding protein
VGSQFWKGLVDWFKDTMVTEKMINPEDVNLFQVIDDPQAIVDAIFKFYETRGFDLSPEEQERQFSL